MASETGRSDLTDLKVSLQSQRFDQQAAVSSAENALKQASLNKDKDEQLFKLHLQTELNVKLTQANWEQATNRFQTEKEKLDIMKDSTKAQLESQQVQIDKLTGGLAAQETAADRPDDPRGYRTAWSRN